MLFGYLADWCLLVVDFSLYFDLLVTCGWAGCLGLF